ncbi:MAG TPA: hypothetical protein VGI14_10895 [Casimicrobiaceae bacterium]|jgi:hypothetical protein
MTFTSTGAAIAVAASLLAVAPAVAQNAAPRRRLNPAAFNSAWAMHTGNTP